MYLPITRFFWFNFRLFLLLRFTFSSPLFYVFFFYFFFFFLRCTFSILCFTSFSSTYSFSSFSPSSLSIFFYFTFSSSSRSSPLLYIFFSFVLRLLFRLPFSSFRGFYNVSHEAPELGHKSQLETLPPSPLHPHLWFLYLIFVLLMEIIRCFHDHHLTFMQEGVLHVMVLNASLLKVCMKKPTLQISNHSMSYQKLYQHDWNKCPFSIWHSNPFI